MATEHTTDWIHKIGMETPMAFVLYPDATNDTIMPPLDCLLDYQLSKSHIGILMEKSVIANDPVLIGQLKDEQIPRIVSTNVKEGVALIHDKSTVLLSQLCNPLKPSIQIIWTGRRARRDVVFVELQIPKGFDIVFKPMFTGPPVLTNACCNY